MIELELPVQTLPKVGKEVARKLGRLGIVTIGDLIKHYPRRYDDFSQIVTIATMKPGLVTIRGTLHAIAMRRSFRRKLTITEAIISDQTGTVKAVWFNQPYLVNTFSKGAEVTVSGRLEFRNNDLAISNPAIEISDAVGRNTGRIVPIYPETDGLSSKQLRGLILPLLPKLMDFPDRLPLEVMISAKLLTAEEALQEIHFPTTGLRLKQAKRRIAFEELFYLMLASLSIKQEIKSEQAPVIKFVPEAAQQFTAALDFTLTDAQRAAAWQILQDLGRDEPMNRLLEGDVGSGKTVVAAMAATMAMHQGYQVALMVPTEILARQHSEKLAPLMKGLGFNISLVLSKDKASAKQLVAEAISSGQSQLVIGTHALLSDPIKFSNLGLVIIDEQHRFGVSQRLALKQKAGRLPHLLSMTATPIPRSLALTVYGDLDISVIATLPPGRQPIVTKIVKNSEREAIYTEIDEQIQQGRQVFVVCPLIEESDKLGAKSAVAEAERLGKTVFGHRRIGLIHGKLKPAEKQAVMESFVSGKLDVLVATSVIEVGIDVPNATIMMIEGADRFGLAALHQLRGRVGRGEHHSFCYLLYENYSPGVAERLRAMERTQDGFRLAQIDLELRGPGQIYGARQHGVLDLAMADISDAKLLAEVRTYAADFLRGKEVMLKYPYILEQVSRLKAVTSLD